MCECVVGGQDTPERVRRVGNEGSWMQLSLRLAAPRLYA